MILSESDKELYAEYDRLRDITAAAVGVYKLAINALSDARNTVWVEQRALMSLWWEVASGDIVVLHGVEYLVDLVHLPHDDVRVARPDVTATPRLKSGKFGVRRMEIHGWHHSSEGQAIRVINRVNAYKQLIGWSQ